MKALLLALITALSCCFTAEAFAAGSGTQPGIRNYEAPGNLESKYDIGCIESGKVKPNYTPTDLYKAMSKCVISGKYKEGVFLFAVAGAYGRFDAYRVADRTAHQAVTVARMQAVSPLSKDKITAFQNSLKTILSNPQGLAEVCKEIKQIGAPDYYPRYMIQHGMNAFLKGGEVNKLVANFNARAAWKKSLDTYLHCPGD